MRVDQIEIHDGEPDRPYETVGDVRARMGARTAFNKAPTLDEINSKLREEALKAGQPESSMSATSVAQSRPRGRG